MQINQPVKESKEQTIRHNEQLIQKNTNNTENANLVAKKFLNKETDIDISEVFFDVSTFEDSIEIAVVDRQKLLEAISFIESTGFKVINTVSMPNDKHKSFVFRSQRDFERQSEIKIQSYFEIFGNSRKSWKS